MLYNNIELTVLIKGRPITEFRHQGQVFVEGRKDSEYEIELRNRMPGRVEVVLSVDGLSVVDGKAAGPQSSGYLVNGYSSVRVPGWILNDQSVAKFAFSGHEDSYSEQSGGDPRNNGVIGIMAFAEKYVAPVYQPMPWYSAAGARGIAPSGAHTSNNTKSIYQNHVSPGAESLSPFNISTYYSGNGASASASFNASTAPSCNADTQSFDAYQPREEKTSGGIITPQVNHLGTAFGESADFATQKVSFVRADMIAMMMIYYDDARGLKARGIDLTRRRHHGQPQAFPGMEGCEPPPGWRG